MHKNRLKVLKFLIDASPEWKDIKDISEATKLSERNVKNLADCLKNVKLVEKGKKEGTSVYSFNKSSPAFNRLIVNFYQDKLSQAEIGEIFGVSGQYISRILRKENIDTCVGGHKGKKSEVKERHALIIELSQKGMSMCAIARQLNMFSSGIKYVLDKYSI